MTRKKRVNKADATIRNPDLSADTILHRIRRGWDPVSAATLPLVKNSWQSPIKKRTHCNLSAR